jgi:hypothetical protein
LAEAGSYLRGLHENADHHAREMFEVYPKVYVAAVAHMEDGSLKVFERLGETKNTAWARFNGQRVALSYDHQGGIEVRQDSVQGTPLARFDCNTPFEEVWNFFERLGSVQPVAQAAPGFILL